MATTEYIVSSGDVGRVFAEVDGFLLSLIQSRPPSGDCYARRWEEKHLRLRDTRSPRDLICLDATTMRPPPLCIGGAYFWINNRCIQFYGELQLLCVPHGSEWEVTISDIFVAPRAPLFPAVSEGYAPTGFWGHIKGGSVTSQSRALPLAAPPLQLAAPIAVPTEPEG
jgi:hypothetical protein